VAVAPENAGEKLGDLLLVVDDEDFRGRDHD
jgi:hypothetical protein